jgi:hypothetical protein
MSLAIISWSDIDWTPVIAAIITAIIAVLGTLGPVVIKWLQSLKVVQQLHLENLVAALIPQVIEWVEYWAEQLIKKGQPKPTGPEKLAKGLELLKAAAPTIASMADENLILRIETELKNGLNKEKTPTKP